MMGYSVESPVVAEEKRKDEDVKKFAALCGSVFSTPDGRLLLDWLTERVSAPVCPHNRPAEYGFFREGENNLARLLLNSVKIFDRGLDGFNNENEGTV